MRGTGASGIVIGDWNGDSIPDLATANPWKDGMVSVLPGCGDGSFTWRKDYPIGAPPSALVSCDLNADQKTDLVTANGEDRTVTVLLGTEDGGFVVQGNYEFATAPLDLACGELNGDGIDDLVVANSAWDVSGPTSTVSVLLGAGDGTLTSTLAYPTVAFPRSVVLGDLDGDGNLDLVSGGSASVSVRRGKGDGTFGASLDHPGPDELTAIAMGDLNGDDYPDLGLGDFGGRGWEGGLRMLPGHGDGTFGEIVAYSPSASVGVVDMADVNNDRRLDLLGTTYAGIGVVLGHGDRGIVHLGNGALNATSLAVGDMNGDCKLDVVTGGGYLIFLRLGRGDGTFPE